MRYAQIIMGLKDSGKSTYCKLMAKYAESKGRKMRIVNLDPKPGELIYEHPVADIRDVVKVEEVEEKERAHPFSGAGFEFVLAYILENPEWLFGSIGDVNDGDYILFDCPGDNGYFIHSKTMKLVATMLVVRHFRTCGVFVRDARMGLNGYNFIGSCLTPLSSYINLAIPHVSVMMKIDLLSDDEKSRLQLFINSEIRDVLRYENARQKPETPVTSSSSPSLSASTSNSNCSNSNSNSSCSSGCSSNCSSNSGSTVVAVSAPSVAPPVPAEGQQSEQLAKYYSTAVTILEGHNMVRKKYYALDIKEDDSLKGFLEILDDLFGINMEED